MMRGMTSIDLPFIYNSWLKSFGPHRPSKTITGNICCGLRDSVFYPAQHALIESLLSRATTVVACSERDTSVIAGYACFEATKRGDLVLHYIYVKDSVRHNGVARRIFDFISSSDDFSKKVIFTHATPTGRSVARKLKEMGIEAEYNPYAAYLGARK